MTATNDFAVDLNDSQKRTDAKSTTVLFFWESDGNPQSRIKSKNSLKWLLDQSHQFQPETYCWGKTRNFQRKILLSKCFFSKTLEFGVIWLIIVHLFPFKYSNKTCEIWIKIDGEKVQKFYKLISAPFSNRIWHTMDPTGNFSSSKYQNLCQSVSIKSDFRFNARKNNNGFAVTN